MTKYVMILMLWSSSSQARESIVNKIHELEKLHNIPPGLLYAVVEQESNFKETAINPNTNPGVAISSHGLGQLTEDTAHYHCRLKKEQIYNKNLNLKCSAKVLKYQLDRFGQDQTLALSAYNDGTPCICDGVKFKYINSQKSCGSKTGYLACKKAGIIKNQKYIDDVLNKHQIWLQSQQVAL